MHTSAHLMKQQFESARASMDFCDSNAWIGPCDDPGYAPAETLDALVEVLDRASTREALVSHFACLRYDPRAGNEMLLDSLSKRSGLWAAIAMTPDLEIEAELERAVGHGARAVRLFPESHSFVLQKWMCGEMLAVLEQRRMPVILRHSEQSWSDIRSLALAHPALPVVVEGTGKKILYDNRIFLRLLDECPNLCLELHNLVNCGIVEKICMRFGDHRLIYGSYAPMREPGAAQMALTHARLPEESRRRIAGGNLRALIAGVVL